MIFTDLLMGDFSGLAEIEGIIQMFLALYIAGTLLRNPRSKPHIWVAAITVVVIDKFLSAAVDMSKVWIGVEDAEFVEGLPQSILLLEGIGFGVDIIISGILFGAIPAMWLIPALHGKIEPLLGMRPRLPGEPVPGGVQNVWFVISAVALSVASFFFAFLEAWDVEVGVVDADFRDQYGDAFLWVSVAGIAVLLIVVWAVSRAQRARAQRDRSHPTAQ